MANTEEFLDKLTKLINECGMDAYTNTNDFLLAGEILTTVIIPKGLTAGFKKALDDIKEKQDAYLQTNCQSIKYPL